MRFVHIADVHWRGLSRHEEYKESFEDFFQQLKIIKPDGIVIAGDIVHSKTQGISPELINNLIWWFNAMAEICQVYVMLGNHDGLVLNQYREDAISPILRAINNKNIHLWKDSGVYPINEDFEFCVLSPFDTSNWDLTPSEDKISICLYHGAIWGSHTDSDWMLEADHKMKILQRYDFSMLGDIHKQQKMDTEGRIWYSGSTIQQNYGESPNKGFLVWDIESKDSWNVGKGIIKHTRPFVTVQWQGSVDKTIQACKEYPNLARFRIRSERQLDPQATRRLSYDLKRHLQATEVVYKIDGTIENTTIIDSAEDITVEDLTSPSVHKKLIREYHDDEETEEFWGKVDKIIDDIIPQVAVNKSLGAKKWSLRSMEFDNTFGYAEKNSINFQNLHGIVGLFGRNRCGKSSIPGTVMYSMYNTSDREISSNLHIINTRKDYCSSKVTFTVADKIYRLERQTTKHKPSKTKPLTTLTYLNLFEVDENNDIILDLTGEQRRETETTLRNLVGSAYDFLLTSFASQGEMNAFIKEGATKRKQIISGFLGLDIFDAFNSKLKENSRDAYLQLKKLKDTDWKNEISKRNVVLRHLVRERTRLEEEIRELRSSEDDLKLLINRDGPTGYSISDVLEKERALSQLEKQIKSYKEDISNIKIELPDIVARKSKFEKIKTNFPIEDLKDRLALAERLNDSLRDARYNLDKQKTVLEGYEKSISILRKVPCGDKFPSCRFIKNSHSDRLHYDNQVEAVEALKTTVADLELQLESHNINKLKERISKYRSMLQTDSSLSVRLSELRSEESDLTLKLEYATEKSKTLAAEIEEMRLNINETEDDETAKINLKIAKIGKNISNKEDMRMQVERAYGNIMAQISGLKEEKLEYDRLALDWKVYDLLTSATSWRGIPTYITSKQLPAINAELSKILQDVVGFTVDLDIDDRKTDVYINYGDSRRPIECASGMEKMVSSLALRVALTNLSCLNKSDMLIIDEGFGSLDATNVEAVTNLLHKLKDSYRIIILISHVDGVKDVVDDIIDIQSDGMDSSVRHI